MTAQAKPAIDPAESQPVMPPLPPKMAVLEYLEMELRSEMRHEYVDGEIIDMAGGSPVHDRLTVNCVTRLEAAFESRPCRAYTGNMHVRVNPT